MPRPSGRAQKIAEDTIPGINRNIPRPSKKKKFIPNDEVELKMTRINENRGRLNYEKKERRV